MPDKTTVQAMQYYNPGSKDWAGTHNTSRFWGEYMDRFHQLLPQGRILEVGCGAGRDARELVELGYDLVATDPSEGMLELAAGNVDPARLMNVGVEDLAFEDEFDGFWASASLLHRTEATIGSDLSNIRRAVKEGAVGFISLKKHVDDLPAERTVEDGRPFTFWMRDTFEQKLIEAGFEVVEFHERPMSESTVWLVFIVRAVQKEG